MKPASAAASKSLREKVTEALDELNTISPSERGKASRAYNLLIILEAQQTATLKEKLIERLDRDRKMKAELAQRIDNAHAEVYSVWNNSNLNVLQMNHLESALAILGHIIDECKPKLEAADSKTEASE